MLKNERVKRKKSSAIKDSFRAALISRYQEARGDLPCLISRKNSLFRRVDIGGESEKKEGGQFCDASIPRDTLKEKFKKRHNSLKGEIFRDKIFDAWRATMPGWRRNQKCDY